MGLFGSRLDNYLEYVNINYPYNHYSINSASIAFSAYNQMRFYLNDSVVKETDFAKYQIGFLTKYRIKWLFCGKGVTLDNELNKMVAKDFYE